MGSRHGPYTGRLNEEKRRKMTMNKMTLGVLGVLICLAVNAMAQPVPASGDHGNDVNVTFPATLLAQNGGPVIDIKHPPEKDMHAAVGDGVADDTAAFQDAYDLIKKNYVAEGEKMRSLFIYIPNGTYKISDTIIYRGEDITSPGRFTPGHYDICRMKFIGQSRAKTILRLVDNAPKFQDKAHPRPLLTFQHPDTIFNNVPGSNEIRNLTINAGSGNPGAAAVMFQAANQSDIRNVTLASGDGGGAYGLWFKIGSVQGYYTDITIEGFDYGIVDAVNPEGDPAIENLTLKNQNVAGIHHFGGGMSLCNVLSDQTAHGATALLIDGTGPQTVIINSKLIGGAAGNPAIEVAKTAQECLFARNVTTSGYGMAVKRAGEAAVPGAVIDEYVSAPVTTLSPGQKTHSLALPIEATPAVPWYDPAKDWAVVDDYPSVQDAMKSGKPVVCFKNQTYALPSDISVPASVKFINLMGTRITGGALLISEASPDPVLVQDGGVSVRVTANRNVIERCMGGGISNPQGLPVTFFLENVNDNATGDNFCRPGQKVYARQIDIEYRKVPQIVANGGTMWVFGFKTEDTGTPSPFVVKNGGTLEVLGGYVNMLGSLAKDDTLPPMITNIDSNASITCFTNMTGIYNVAVRETRNGQTNEIKSSDLPLRGSVYRRNFVIPLYVGYQEK